MASSVLPGAKRSTPTPLNSYPSVGSAALITAVKVTLVEQPAERLSTKVLLLTETDFTVMLVAACAGAATSSPPAGTSASTAAKMRVRTEVMDIPNVFEGGGG